MFTNRVAVLATMHQKEKVIAPLLQQKLGLQVIVPENLNTDQFGTFTREIPRSGTQIAAAKLKALTALELTGENIGIASEGSFAPHPHIPYIYANREIIIFIDKENKLEIFGEVFSLDTNFNHQSISNLAEAQEFAEKVGFPDHGLVISCQLKHQSDIHLIKGITTESKFIESVNWALNNSQDHQINIETDMRAMYNPTRMKNIEKATADLIQKLNSCCPKCGTPGFAVTDRKPGLPCDLCHQPTSLTLAAIYQCQNCGFRQEKLFPNGQEFADPSQCIYCNP
jgi:Zn finger protein HypA/HybF involved in hydrogenase expression